MVNLLKRGTIFEGGGGGRPNLKFTLTKNAFTNAGWVLGTVVSNYSHPNQTPVNLTGDWCLLGVAMIWLTQYPLCVG
jgi:hypothetical protein